MAAAGVAMAAVGTILQVGGNRQAKKSAENADRERRENALWYGYQQREKAEFEAAQLERQAGKAIAVGQRESMEIQRAAKLTESRALAIAAASGGGASAPTVTNLIGKIAQRGAYEASVALYNGEERARELSIAAAAKRFEGAIAIEAGDRGMTERVSTSAFDLSSSATLLQGAGSLLAKYGGSGPSATAVGQVSESVPGQFSTVDPAYG